MATSQQVLAHMTGHTGGRPLQLSWQAQARWDQVIQHAVQDDTALSMLIMVSGGNPCNW